MPALNTKIELEELLGEVVTTSASDLHLSVGRHPTLRIDGALLPLAKHPVLTPEAAEELSFLLLTPEQKNLFLAEQEIDFSYGFADKARFRVNVFRQRGFVSAALRLIPSKIRTIEELNLPVILHRFTKLSQGFFLCVGPAGHGKSTTLAALIDEINHTRTEHVITIEDPIEYAFSQDRSIVDQREVHHDTKGFHRALRSALRQAPNVIMIGEMRDPETISAAITAAETGHLVLASLHTNNAAQTIDRIIYSFPPGQQSQIRTQLAGTIVGIISQRLIPRIDGGRTPVAEILIANPAVRNLIRENKTHQIEMVIETSTEEGMVALNRSLEERVRRGEVSPEIAEMYSLNPAELRQLLSR
ncbi:PilT/PilU family type 4a pilus ATPase [Candidatus Parcubacteria bacterium]|nr:PilT/PilU family type 4a pilus ATPase [Candidatus Parcubacteria bacterium]